MHFNSSRFSPVDSQLGMCGNDSAQGPDHALPGSVLAAKTVVLAVTLALEVVGNVYVVVRTAGRPGKWSAPHYMLKVVAVSGIISGLVNLSVYITNVVKGGWVLGEVYCQIHGVLGSILVAGITWLFTIAAFERYIKLLLPAEHESFFSKINTKIMVWGMFLLLAVFNLGPVYGWGEYSNLRGKLDIRLSVKPTANLTALGEAQVYHCLVSESPSAQLALNNVTGYLRQKRHAVVRKPLLDRDGIILPVRLEHGRGLRCLWADFKAGKLQVDLHDLLADSTCHLIQGESIMVFLPFINDSDYSSYRDTYLQYQDASTCSLDYSPVNANVRSFIGFNTLANLALPLVLTLGFYLCVFCISRPTEAGLGAADEAWMSRTRARNTRLARVFAIAALTNILCQLPHLAASLAALQGRKLSTHVHFLGHAILYFSPASLFIAHSLIYRCTLVSFKDEPSLKIYQATGSGQQPQSYLQSDSNKTTDVTKRKTSCVEVLTRHSPGESGCHMVSNNSHKNTHTEETTI